MSMALLAVASCGKDNDETLDPEGDIFKAKIEGKQFNSDNVTGTQVFGIIMIGATFGADAETFDLTLIATDEGTYSFDTQSDVAGFYVPSALSSTEQFGAYTGSLTIEKHDAAKKRISGVFEFDGINADNETIQITDGFFDLVYQ